MNTTGDNPRVSGKRQCKICRKWFSSSTNAQGWKVHLSVQHRITLQSHTGGSDDSQTLSTQIQQTMKTVATPPYLLRKYENAIIDLLLAVTSPFVLLENHDSRTLFMHSQMATNLRRREQSFGGLLNCLPFLNPCLQSFCGAVSMLWFL
jgi:hypothetical protein